MPLYSYEWYDNGSVIGYLATLLISFSQYQKLTIPERGSLVIIRMTNEPGVSVWTEFIRPCLIFKHAALYSEEFIHYATQPPHEGTL